MVKYTTNVVFVVETTNLVLIALVSQTEKRNMMFAEYVEETTALAKIALENHSERKYMTNVVFVVVMILLAGVVTTFQTPTKFTTDVVFVVETMMVVDVHTTEMSSLKLKILTLHSKTVAPTLEIYQISNYHTTKKECYSNSTTSDTNFTKKLSNKILSS